MDNFEHVLGGAVLVAELLEAAPRLKVLATSRERLGLQAEVQFVLEGLSLPDAECSRDPLSFSAPRLFAETARRASFGFSLGANDADVVTRICQLVEGMPLGVIMAASWVGALALPEIADELSTSLDFIEADLCASPARQHSIRAVFDRSWALLNAEQRLLFAKLSVFRGGFSRAAAETVAQSTLRALAALINKSLVQRKPRGGRYVLHELLRQYAEAKLQDTPLERRAIRERHA
jgi:predicted ATPase